MSGDLLFVVGSLLAFGLAWITVAVVRFNVNVQQTSRSVEQARWEAIAMLRAQRENERRENALRESEHHAETR